MSLAEVVEGLEAVQEAQVAAARAEAARGDALFEVAVAALHWCRADLQANPASRGHRGRVELLEVAVRRWARKKEAPRGGP